MALRFGILLGLFLLASSCTDFKGQKSASNKNLNIDVIYGSDDRIDYYQEKDSHWQALAQSSVALIDHRDFLEDEENGEFFNLDSLPYGLSGHLCEDEAFYHQPKVSFCSGFLIGSDLIVTAGHCLRNRFNCENVRFVFDYHLSASDANPLRIHQSQIYHCKELIHTQANAITGSDFALARLNKKVAGYSPLPLRTSGKMDPKTKLTVIGYPSGLPLKIAHQGKVRDLTPSAFFVATLDTYGGNSGSAVINSQTRLVEGILVNGDTDFVFDQEKNCRISNVCKETSCRGEDVTRISEILPYLTPNDLAL